MQQPSAWPAPNLTPPPGHRDSPARRRKPWPRSTRRFCKHRRLQSALCRNTKLCNWIQVSSAPRFPRHHAAPQELATVAWTGSALLSTVDTEQCCFHCSGYAHGAPGAGDSRLAVEPSGFGGHLCRLVGQGEGALGSGNYAVLHVLHLEATMLQSDAR